MRLIPKNIPVRKHERRIHGSKKKTTVRKHDRTIQVGILSEAERRAVMERRSKRAITQDKRRTGRIPMDERSWERHPNLWDLEGVDTKGSVDGSGKDYPKKAPGLSKLPDHMRWRGMTLDMLDGLGFDDHTIQRLREKGYADVADVYKQSKVSPATLALDSGLPVGRVDDRLSKRIEKELPAFNESRESTIQGCALAISNLSMQDQTINNQMKMQILRWDLAKALTNNPNREGGSAEGLAVRYEEARKRRTDFAWKQFYEKMYEEYDNGAMKKADVLPEMTEYFDKNDAWKKRELVKIREWAKKNPVAYWEFVRYSRKPQSMADIRAINREIRGGAGNSKANKDVLIMNKLEKDLMKRIENASTLKELKEIDNDLNGNHRWASGADTMWRRYHSKRIGKAIDLQKGNRKDQIRLRKQLNEVRKYEKIHGLGSWILSKSDGGTGVPQVGGLPGGIIGKDAPKGYLGESHITLTFANEHLDKKKAWKKQFLTTLNKHDGKIVSSKKGIGETRFSLRNGSVLVAQRHLDQAEVELGGIRKIYATGPDQPIVVKGKRGYRLIAPRVRDW